MEMGRLYIPQRVLGPLGMQSLGIREASGNIWSKIARLGNLMVVYCAGRSLFVTCQSP